MMRRQETPLIFGGAAIASIAIALLAYVIWWRRNPSACPYRGWRFTLELPRPPWLTRDRLREILAPRLGERMLEVGPGTGYYALEVARWITPDGKLDVLDIQQEMLDHTMRRASDLCIDNIIPTQGDAQALPYPDDTFDAAYVVLTLGEIPNQNVALLELHRVLKSGGRLVVGESFPTHTWSPSTPCVHERRRWDFTSNVGSGGSWATLLALGAPGRERKLL